LRAPAAHRLAAQVGTLRVPELDAAGGEPDGHVGESAIIVDDEVEVAERRIVLGIVKRDVAPQAKVQVADIGKKGHKLQVGVQAPTGRRMGLEAVGMNDELNVNAMAPQDIETCGLADNETFRCLGA
jgi:hypothetical protein